MAKKLRPDIDEYFLKIAKVVGERATCYRRRIGALAVKDKQILATGYNGAPAGMKDCLELGCLRDQMNIPSGSSHVNCRSVHAEMNVIVQAATHGVSLKGATIYCTTAPCALCARMLVNAGISRYVCYVDYPNKEANELFKVAGIKFEVLTEPTFDPDKIGEQVLAVSEDNFIEAGYFQGFKKEDDGEFYQKILSNVRYIDREDAEVNDAWKQIIPYILVRFEDKYLVLKRLDDSGESRLKEAYSFGVGGHINSNDSSAYKDGSDVIESGMLRELNEEIKLAKLDSLNLVGYVYTELQDVSRHHIAFVYEAILGSEEYEILEKDQLEPYLVDVIELPKYLNNNEQWAEIIYKEYISKNVVNVG